jgi:hypothetical protein
MARPLDVLSLALSPRFPDESRTTPAEDFPGRDAAQHRLLSAWIELEYRSGV